MFFFNNCVISSMLSVIRVIYIFIFYIVCEIISFLIFLFLYNTKFLDYNGFTESNELFNLNEYPLLFGFFLICFIYIFSDDEEVEFSSGKRNFFVVFFSNLDDVVSEESKSQRVVVDILIEFMGSYEDESENGGWLEIVSGSEIIVISSDDSDNDVGEESLSVDDE